MRRCFFLPSISPVSPFPLSPFSPVPCPPSLFRFTPDANYLLLNRAILTKPLLFLFNDTRAPDIPFPTSRNVCTRGALLFNESTRLPYGNEDLCFFFEDLCSLNRKPGLIISRAWCS